jgi:hypothetical protein
MFSINFQWKEFNINLEAVEAWMKEYVGDSYCGNSADSKLTLWFHEVPSQELMDDIQAYWNGLTEESTEATSYKTATELANEVAAAKTAAKASATSKLAALGLSAEEIAAIVG